VAFGSIAPSPLSPLSSPSVIVDNVDIKWPLMVVFRAGPLTFLLNSYCLFGSYPYNLSVVVAQLVGCRTCDQEVVGSTLDYCGKVVDTFVVLSSNCSLIPVYVRRRSGAGKVTVDWYDGSIFDFLANRFSSKVLIYSLHCRDVCFTGVGFCVCLSVTTITKKL